MCAVLNPVKIRAMALYGRNLTFSPCIINPLNSKGNYSATSNNMKLVHWLLMSAVPNVTAHPSTASVPTTVAI